MHQMGYLVPLWYLCGRHGGVGVPRGRDAVPREVAAVPLGLVFELRDHVGRGLGGGGVGVPVDGVAELVLKEIRVEEIERPCGRPTSLDVDIRQVLGPVRENIRARLSHGV